MDRLQKCIDVLRRLAKEPDDPDGVVLAEQAINDYLRKDIEALRAALEKVGRAIDEKAANRVSGEFVYDLASSTPRYYLS